MLSHNANYDSWFTYSNICQAVNIYSYAAYQLMQQASGNKMLSDLTSHLMQAFQQAHVKCWSSPQVLASYCQEWQKNYLKPLEISDKRFSNPQWHESPMYAWLYHAYKAHSDSIMHAIDHSGLSGLEALRLRFFYKMTLDSACPLNFIASNPEVQQQIEQTKGDCLLQGARNFLLDVQQSHDGYMKITTVDDGKFIVGKNLACTQGKVVYQNYLFQLIQYSPSTEQVNEIPLLLITAWINKYYILDLQQENSFIKWLVDQGHTVFCVSWNNPDSDIANFEDYMQHGALQAMEEVLKITKAPKINCIGYCLGGTMLAISLAYLKANKRDIVNSATFLTAMVDFADCGDVAAFIDDETIKILDSGMAEKGVLDGDAMFLTFCIMRSSDMVWSYFVNNYLLGKTPSAFDILVWNADRTNLTRSMHHYYLTNLYRHNLLSKPNGITIAGTPIDLSKIDVPMYLLATEADHISPWKSVYKGACIYNSKNKKFVLAKSGHTAGVVNHPSKNRYGYYSNDKIESNAQSWLAGAQEFGGSWWPNMQKWLEDNKLTGNKVAKKALDIGIEDAPGSYIYKKAP